jgi:hypothetical protein
VKIKAKIGRGMMEDKEGMVWLDDWDERWDD